MELKDAIALIDSPPKSHSPQTWADLGCGSGLFTYALAHLLSPESVIYAVDKSPAQLVQLPNPQGVVIHPIRLDFVNEPFPFHALDGTLMANSLHFVRDKTSFLRKLGACLKADGKLLIVEYDTDRPNPWVPYPVSYQSLTKLFEELDRECTIIRSGAYPSRYQTAPMYAALVTVP